jgi:magnesium-transporting ATPase (P-type)
MTDNESGSCNIEWYTKSIEEVSGILQVNLNEGLDSAEIIHRQQKHGLNKVSAKKKKDPIVLFIRQFHILRSWQEVKRN